VVRDHQLNEAVFRSILPEDIDWKPFPAFPPSARLAVLVGEPAQAGPYVIRVKVAEADVENTGHDGIDSVLGVRSRHIHPAASSCCRAIPGISTGQSPASTSLR
jgi:hypothetical protein